MLQPPEVVHDGHEVVRRAGPLARAVEERRQLQAVHRERDAVAQLAAPPPLRDEEALEHEREHGRFAPEGHAGRVRRLGVLAAVAAGFRGRVLGHRLGRAHGRQTSLQSNGRRRRRRRAGRVDERVAQRAVVEAAAERSGDVRGEPHALQTARVVAQYPAVVGHEAPAVRQEHLRPGERARRQTLAVAAAGSEGPEREGRARAVVGHGIAEGRELLPDDAVQVRACCFIFDNPYHEGVAEEAEAARVREVALRDVQGPQRHRAQRRGRDRPRGVDEGRHLVDI